MKPSFLIILSFFFASIFATTLSAQVTRGSIVYEEVVKMDLSGQEDLDPAMKQLLSQMPEESVMKAKMDFHEDGYSYVQLPRTAEDMEAESGGVSLKISYASNEPEKWYFDRTNQAVKQSRNIMNRSFQIADQPHDFGWVLSDEKETDAASALPVLKATGINAAGDTVTAWYTTSIQLPYGPRDYAGLPGLIVRVENDNRTYRIKELNLAAEKPVLTPPYESGKTMTIAEYTKLREKKMADFRGGARTKVIRMN